MSVLKPTTSSPVLLFPIASSSTSTSVSGYWFASGYLGNTLPAPFTDQNGTNYTAQAYTFSKSSSITGTSLTSYSSSTYPYIGGFTVTVGSNTFVVAPILCICSGPEGSTSGWSSPYSDSTATGYGSTYNTSYYVGPSFVDSFAGNNGSNGIYEYISYFYIAPYGWSASYVFPAYYFLGVPTFSSLSSSTPATSNAANSTYINSLNTSNGNPLTWMLFYQAPQGDFTCSSNPIIGNVGFPYYDYSAGTSTGNLEFLYFQVIFAMPYCGGEYMSNLLYSSTTNSNSNVIYPNVPGYVLAFYNRSNPICSTSSPYSPTTQTTNLLSTNPNSTSGGGTDTSYGNYYPVIYEATNLCAQSNGTLQYNQTLLGFLNNIYGITEAESVANNQTLHDFLYTQGWLENVTTSGSSTNSAGSSTSIGIDFGNVYIPSSSGSTSVPLGSGWWFAGYVPYNYVIGASSQNWTTTQYGIWGPTGNIIDFTSGNVVLATAVPLSGATGPNIYNPGDVGGATGCATGCTSTGTAIGNYFWDSITTNSYNWNMTTMNVYILMKGGYMQANGVASIDNTYPATNPEYTTPGLPGLPYLTASCVGSSAYKDGYTLFQVYFYQNPYYSSVTIYINYDGGYEAISNGNGTVTNAIEVINYSEGNLAVFAYSNNNLVVNFPATGYEDDEDGDVVKYYLTNSKKLTIYSIADYDLWYASTPLSDV